MTEDPYARRLENEAKLKEWREAKQREAAEQKRQEKRGALETYLRERSQEWIDTTGEQPTVDEIRHWKRQYMDEQQLLKEAERAERIAQAMEHYPGQG